MFAFAAVVMPLVGLGRWGLRLPAGPEASGLFVLAMIAVALLSASITVLIDIVTVASLNDRGANLLIAPFSSLLSGGIVPLAFYPDWLRPALRLQPFAGLMDTPFRIYFGELTGWDAAAALALQLAWAVALAALGRAWLGRAMGRLQVQGG